MLKPEQIRYVMAWAKSGNEWRASDDLPDMDESALIGDDDGCCCRLSTAGLTIAALGAALIQANETAERGAMLAAVKGPLYEPIETMRANLKELLG